MAAFRKFTFDDPEDSYWNTNGSTNLSFFDTSQSPSTAARTALDNLFEMQERLGNDISSCTSQKDPTDGSKSLSASSPELIIPSLPDKNTKESDTSQLFHIAPIQSAASIVSDCSIGSFSSEPPSQLDYLRLKSEHRKLQKHLEHVRLEKYKPCDPNVAIRRMLLCEPVSLDLFRSKKEKFDLLEAAIDSYDGNVIVRVIIFLQTTLSRSLFVDVLKRKPLIADHYLAYLKESEDYEQISAILLNINRADEAAMADLASAFRNSSIEQRLNDLKKCFTSGSQDEVQNSKFIGEYVDLTERQIAIEVNDEALINEGKDKTFKEFPKMASLIHRPLLTTVYYCCLYHYDLPMNAFASPLSLRDVFQVSDKQYVWMATSALSRQQRWSDIERLLTEKKLLGGSKLTCPFTWSSFFTVLSREGEPPKEVIIKVMCKFLRAVPDLKERLQIAEKFPVASEVVIDCLVSQKDRYSLRNFASKLKPQSSEALKAINILNNTTYKWIN